VIVLLVIFKLNINSMKKKGGQLRANNGANLRKINGFSRASAGLRKKLTAIMVSILLVVT
jgi:hypothetical protein